MKKFFSHSPNGDGFEFHDTEEEAKQAVQRAFAEEKTNSHVYGWNLDAVDVCWGEVKAKVVQSGLAEYRLEDANDA